MELGTHGKQGSDESTTTSRPTRMLRPGVLQLASALQLALDVVDDLTSSSDAAEFDVRLLAARTVLSAWLEEDTSEN